MIIDGKDMIGGRLATKVAKMALRGEEVKIVNAELVAISGPKECVMKRFLQSRKRGDPHHGPYFSRIAKAILKRMIRGMLPYKQAKGREALKRVMCYHGVPEAFQGQELVTFKDIHVKKLPIGKYLTLKQISEELGVKR
ncbi:MAG: 50S ribosomal protein L13 [archaeon]